MYYFKDLIKLEVVDMLGERSKVEMCVLYGGLLFIELWDKDYFDWIER